MGFTIAAAVKNTITSAIARIITPIMYIEIRNAFTVPMNSSTGAAIITVQSVVFIVAKEDIFLLPSYE